MKVTYKKASTDARTALLAADALRARLFVPGWMLGSELSLIKSLRDADNYETCIAVAYQDGVAIGVCTSRRWTGYKNPNIMVFVRKKHRRCGIGTKLVKKATIKNPGFGYGSGVTVAAERFFLQFKHAERD